MEAWQKGAVFLSTGVLFGFIDYAVVHRERNGRYVLLIRGWLFHPDHRIKKLLFPALGGQEVVVYGLTRSDVSEAFPWTTHASSSGFLVALHLPSGFALEEGLSLSFTVVLEDSSTIPGRFGRISYTLFPASETAAEKNAGVTFGRNPDFAARRLILYTSPEQQQHESAAVTDKDGTAWVHYGGVSEAPDTFGIGTKDELRVFLAHQASSLEELVIIGKKMRRIFMECTDPLLCFAGEVKYSYT